MFVATPAPYPSESYPWSSFEWVDEIRNGQQRCQLLGRQTGKRLSLREVIVTLKEVSYEAICVTDHGQVVNAPFTSRRGPTVDERGACPSMEYSNYILIGVTIAGTRLEIECQRDGGGLGPRIVTRTFVVGKPEVSTSP